jgi:hypothetical protein
LLTLFPYTTLFRSEHVRRRRRRARPPWQNDPSVLGTDVSHGCVRMSNDKITSLAGLLPFGTPVQISA